jgi:hypothetical protein
LQAQAGSAPQLGSSQQLVHAVLQQSPRRPRAARARPRRRGSQQEGSAAQQAGSAAPQAGSAAAHPAPHDGSAAQQAGSAAQVGPQSQLARPRRPRLAADAESAATKPTTTRTMNIVTIEEKRFMETLLEETKPNRSPCRN